MTCGSHPQPFSLTENFQLIYNSLFCFTLLFAFSCSFLVVRSWGPRFDTAWRGLSVFIFQIFDWVVVFKIFFRLK